MSAVEVEILGDGAFAGARANIGDYTVTEYASPLGLNDMQSGVGGLSFDAIEDTGFNGSMLLPRQPFRISDPYAGNARGVIDGGVSSDGISLSVSASGSLLPLVSRRTLPALDGTLGAILIRYFQECGMTDVNWQMDPDVTTKHITTPSWNGDVWTQIKKLMAIHQFELAEVDGAIVVRKQRLRSVDVSRYTGTRLSYGQTDATQSVEVYYYNNEWKVNEQVYPDPESSIVDRSIIQVGASETTVTNVPVNMWVSTIDEPEQVVTLPWDGGSSTSVYSVVDKDGQPVRPADWQNGGGMVSFAIGVDRKSIDITVRGMSTSDRAPYRIASSSEDMEYQYAALYIAATGVAFERKMVWAPTGADLVDAPVDEVLTIDDPMVSTIHDAQVILAEAVMTTNGFAQTFEAETTHINRRGETGQILYPSFGEYDATLPVDYTFALWNTDNPLITFEQFTSDQAALVADDFENQAFGGIGGARVRERNSMYRIRTGSARPGSFNWSADHDNLFSDWGTEFDVEDFSFQEFNDMWDGKTFEQHARMPLAAPFSRWTERARNLIPNSKFVAGTGFVEVRRNQWADPVPTSATRVNGLARWGDNHAQVTVSIDSDGWLRAQANANNADGTVFRAANFGANSFPISASTTITHSFEMEKLAGLPDPIFYRYEYDASNTAVVSNAASTLQTAPNGRKYVTFTTTATTTKAIFVMRRPTNSWLAGDWYRIRYILQEVGSLPLTWFSGSAQATPDADLTPAWTGAAGASASILNGVPVAGVNATRCAAIRSSEFGGSMRLIPTDPTNPDTFASVTIPASAYAQGTIMGTLHLGASQTGTLDARARRLAVFSPNQNATQAPNAPGSYPQRLVYSALTTTYQARFYNGARLGGGDVYWTLPGLFAGDYAGPQFTGDTVPSNPTLERYRWVGAVDNSASVYETRNSTLD